MSGISKKCKVKITDIARELSLSPATVSNVLSGRRQGQSEAGRRVREYVKEIGYQPTNSHSRRRSIRLVIYKKHGRVIADTPFFSDLIAAIEHACRQDGYALNLIYLDMLRNPVETRTFLQKLKQENDYPTLLLATEMGLDDMQPFLSMDSPLVVVDSMFSQLPLNVVVMDNLEAGRLATECLIQNGHRHIGLITSSFAFQNMIERETSWRETLTQAGLEAREEDIFRVEPAVEGAAADMLKQLRAHRAPLPTAFFAANDFLAIGAFRALTMESYRVPEDISLIGMDDMPYCQIMQPPLSTIRVPKTEIGRQAVLQLTNMMKEETKTFARIRLSVSLVERGSVMNRT